MTTKHPRAIDYDDMMAEELRNKDFTIGYLNECLQDKDDAVFLIALKQVVDANETKVSDLFKKSGLNRESLYKILSSKGNPEWRSVRAILDGLGMKLTIAG